MITQNQLKQLFSYDPVRGDLVWKDRPAEDFTSDRAYRMFRAKYAGKTAGSFDAYGYKIIRFKDKPYKAHRLIWCFVFGEFPPYPEFEIDHVNGDRADNRIQNLRKCTKSMNQRNGSMHVNNKSGVNGVHWVVRDNVWRATIVAGGTRKFIGNFKSLNEAASARLREEAELGFHPGHGKYSRYGEMA